jgi:hypothetical protein
MTNKPIANTNVVRVGVLGQESDEHDPGDRRRRRGGASIQKNAKRCRRKEIL